MIEPPQCRAARALLGLSQAELARLAGVGLSTLRDIETGWRARKGRSQVSAEALAKVRAALEAAGVEFIEENGGGLGVRIRKPQRRRSRP